MIHAFAGRARRGRRFASALLAAGFVLALRVAASAQAADTHLDELHYRDLLGIWSCQGADRTGAAFRSTLEWGFNDTGEFFFNADPKPISLLHPVADESWLYDIDAGGYYWRAVPDAGAEDPATWITRGWTGAKLSFVRVSSDTPMSRTFERTAPNHLTFRQQQTPNHPIFTLTCIRTNTNAPR